MSCQDIGIKEGEFVVVMLSKASSFSWREICGLGVDPPT